MISTHGVRGASHRRVAAAAGVPLGSTTYHYSGKSELHYAAFSRFVAHTARAFEARMAGAEDPSHAEEEIIATIREHTPAAHRDGVVMLELHAIAAREPAYRALTGELKTRRTTALGHHFSEATASTLNALIEGLTVHRTLHPEPPGHGFVREAVRRVVDNAVDSASRERRAPETLS